MSGRWENEIVRKVKMLWFFLQRLCKIIRTKILFSDNLWFDTVTVNALFASLDTPERERVRERERERERESTFPICVIFPPPYFTDSSHEDEEKNWIRLPSNAAIQVPSVLSPIYQLAILLLKYFSLRVSCHPGSAEETTPTHKSFKRETVNFSCE